jgi:type I restriction enzyme, S subunit
MGKYKTYEKYKPSGVEWLGEVPEHWDARKLKFIASLNMGQSTDSSDYNYDGEGVPFLQGKAEFGSVYPNPFLYTQTAKKFALKDDIFLSVRAPVGDLNIADQEYGIGRGLCAIRPLEGTYGNFLWYFLEVGKNELLSIATGSTYEAVSISQVANMQCILPHLEEQKLIARFLDRETTRIDILITKKRQLIALLQKKRDAIIHQAVTEGIDLTASLEDSGISWIGKIPKNWHIMRLKFLTERIEQGWSPQCENRLAEEDEWGVLKVGCVNYGYFNELEHKALPIDLQPKLEYRINIGDILVSRANTKELVGSTARVSELSCKLLLCDKLYRLAICESIIPDYFVLILNSKIIRFQFERDSSGASDSMQNIAQSSMMNFLIPLPPIAEQKSILKLLQKKLYRIEEIREKIAEQLEDLDKHRISLITAAVTGKIDVREEVN